jgi:hypothetical protein
MAVNNQDGGQSVFYKGTDQGSQLYSFLEYWNKLHNMVQRQ